MVQMMLVFLIAMLILLTLFASLMCCVFGTCDVIDVAYPVDHYVVVDDVVVVYADDIVWYCVICSCYCVCQCQCRWCVCVVCSIFVYL